VTLSATALLRSVGGAGSALAGPDLRLVLKYGLAGAIRTRSPRVARRCAELVGRERADPALHRARAEALLARTLRAARRIPAHATLAARAPRAGLLEWLRDEVPFMDKTSLKERRAQYYPNGGRRRPWWPLGESSGSTGSPTEVFRSFDSVLWEEAFHRQHWSWAGIGARERQAVLRGDRVKPLDEPDPPYGFEDRIGRQLVLSTRHLDERTAVDFAEAIARFGAVQLRAYPSAAYALAAALEGRRPRLRLWSVITGSEMLYPFQRAKIQAALGARVYSFYGMSERVAFAAECEHGRMHVNPEYSIVEIVDRDGRPTDGEGFLVGTTLRNAAMPLLRYRLTDTARWDPRPCPCGRTYPVIDALAGKVEDRLYDLRGRPVTAAVVGFAYKGLLNISKGQIAQTARDRWVARLVPGPRYGVADAERFLANVRAHVSADVNVAIELVDDIPALPSGKYKWVSQEWRGAEPQI
jgi:phenylacetate-coenzyme A ligase PaaK-like adenylate-forming protein